MFFIDYHLLSLQPLCIKRGLVLLALARLGLTAAYLLAKAGQRETVFYKLIQYILLVTVEHKEIELVV